jgi:hypothetical protein
MLGNWSLGQALGHLAAARHDSIDGTDVKPPWHIRLIASFFKRSVLRRLPAGFRLPAEAEKLAVPPAALTAHEGLARLREAVARLRRESQRAPHFTFGTFSAEHWEAFHCRHAELHLSFAIEDEP